MNASISVVIPNYNGRELLESNLPSVFTALRSSGITDFEVIIPDDASSDDSATFIRKKYPEIILVEHEVNNGFSSNTNSGIRVAGKQLVLILNNDVSLRDDYFKSLLPYFYKPDTFGVMGRIMDEKSEKIRDGAKFPGYSFGRIGSTSNYTSADQTSLPSLFLSGANALIDRKKLVELGGFNELFDPYYCEDADLGLRAWRAGYRCYYEHNAVCRHPLSSTVRKEPGKKVKITSRKNKMILHYLHLDNFELSFYLTLLFIKTFLRGIMFDSDHVVAWSIFRRSLKSCRVSKAAFREQCGKRNVDVSVGDVVRAIRKEINELKIERF